MKEESFGIIPFRKCKNRWQVLLIFHKNGKHWGFPKGKKDYPEEPPLEVAKRELREETGLNVVTWLLTDPFKELYSFRRKNEFVNKTVYYFIAEVAGTLVLQKEEIKGALWLQYEEALQKLTFPELKNLCTQAFSFVQKL